MSTTATTPSDKLTLKEFFSPDFAAAGFVNAAAGDRIQKSFKIWRGIGIAMTVVAGAAAAVAIGLVVKNRRDQLLQQQQSQGTAY
ncbi:MAG: hypothetical protein WC763_07385 [Candidatus Paceibacterota bacterium]|jgi:hypothetical protein